MTAHLRDLAVHLPDRPGALADLVQALGRAGVSLAGGGVFTHDGQALAKACRDVLVHWDNR
ncbi:ACT domain-containing protein [Streptomyces sp. NRRL S-1448]|uniref:ACT domain-containing protein n=1 Tax=Streptomyces sp. NRRL S-1448 TaxID=1463883 RepID=UPI0004BE5C43|nr:ACT domain-containing protein [Streptomyces sp. NRRL S-1448]